ncbi:MAG: hypothetical protein AABX72_05085 [Nanoarchaeota archaeon]
MKFKESETNKMQIMSTLGWCAATLFSTYAITSLPINPETSTLLGINVMYFLYNAFHELGHAIPALFMGKFKSISIGLTANTSRIRIEKLDTKEDFVVGLGGPFANVIIPPAVALLMGRVDHKVPDELIKNSFLCFPLIQGIITFIAEPVLKKISGKKVVIDADRIIRTSR